MDDKLDKRLEEFHRSGQVDDELLKLNKTLVTVIFRAGYKSGWTEGVAESLTIRSPDPNEARGNA